MLTLTVTELPSDNDVEILHGAIMARTRVDGPLLPNAGGATKAKFVANFGQPWLKLPVQHGKFGSRFIVVASAPSRFQKWSSCVAAATAFGCCRY